MKTRCYLLAALLCSFAFTDCASDDGQSGPRRTDNGSSPDVVLSGADGVGGEASAESAGEDAADLGDAPEAPDRWTSDSVEDAPVPLDTSPESVLVDFIPEPPPSDIVDVPGDESGPELTEVSPDPDCVPYHHKGCLNFDYLWFDSCGAPGELIEHCSSNYECSDDGCVYVCGGPDSLECIDDDVWWVDECGAPAMIAEACGAGFTCSGTSCVPGVPSSWSCDSFYYDDGAGCDCECGAVDPDCAIPGAEVWHCEAGQACDPQGHCTSICSSYAWVGCHQGDIWWIDSCNVAEQLKSSCGGLGCEDATCLPAPPSGLRINELLYDTAGDDREAFVELIGPAGVSLEGFVLQGINGNGGWTYNVLELSGTMPADGVFVVMQPSAPTAWLAQADLLDDDANYQNGPDSVQLLYGGVVMDALAYGDFSGGSIAAGEGSPAPDVLPERSLSRDASGSDTDDNATDFTDHQPSPGQR